jgi:hypothetical protein
MTQVDMDSQLMDDMDSGLLRFLQTTVNTFIKWDLLRYFHDNPHAVDTAENIGRYISRDAAAVEKDLDGLVASGVLRANDVPEARVYALSSDAEMQASVEKFMQACSDRQFRVKAIYHVIRAMR